MLRITSRLFSPNVNQLSRTFATNSNMSVKPTINVDVTSDNVCPWCYVGKRRLEQAIKASPQYNFQINWNPYFLRPDLPKEEQGMPVKEYLARVYGGRIDPSRMNYLRQQGQDVGINFNDDRVMLPTLDSHRLVEYARKQGKQDVVIDKVFRSYFEEAKNIADHDVLVSIAESAGLDPQATRQYLASGADAQEIAAKDKQAKSKLVSGVPHFVISSPDGSGKKVNLSGAQPAESFFEAFERVV